MILEKQRNEKEMQQLDDFVQAVFMAAQVSDEKKRVFSKSEGVRLI